MSELHTLQRPAHLIAPPIDEPIELRPVKNDSLTIPTTTQMTVETIHDDGLSYLETVLSDPRSQKELDFREAEFVSYYSISKNALQSALDAGYAKGTATSRAYLWVKCDLEKNPKIHIFAALHSQSNKIHKKAVKQAATKLSNQVIDTQWVLDQSVKHVERSSGVIPTHVTKRIDPLSGAEVLVEHYDYDGGQVAKGIELVAKNKKVKAFSNEVEINADSSLAQLLINIAPNSGLPAIDSEAVDADIVEDVPNITRPALPPV
jgi:hypothetical protein